MTDQTKTAGGDEKPAAKSAAKSTRKRSAKDASAKVARSASLTRAEIKRIGLDPGPYGKLKD